MRPNMPVRNNYKICMNNAGSIKELLVNKSLRPMAII